MAEPNGDVRILTVSSEIAVCVDAQYRFGQKQSRTTGVTSGGIHVAMHRTCHHLSALESSLMLDKALYKFTFTLLYFTL